MPRGDHLHRAPAGGGDPSGFSATPSPTAPFHGSELPDPSACSVVRGRGPGVRAAISCRGALSWGGGGTPTRSPPPVAGLPPADPDSHAGDPGPAHKGGVDSICGVIHVTAY